jgi:hypothetical protein
MCNNCENKYSPDLSKMPINEALDYISDNEIILEEVGTSMPLSIVRAKSGYFFISTENLSQLERIRSMTGWDSEGLEIKVEEGVTYLFDVGCESVIITDKRGIHKYIV